MRSNKRARIFLIDPDPAFAADLGTQLVSAFGAERLQLSIYTGEAQCLEEKEKPSVILLGLSKGKSPSEGVAALERLKKQFACKVILLPSDGDGDTIRSARLSGVSDCFVKSAITSKMLVEKLSVMHGRALRSARPQGPFQLPIMMTPGALIAFLLTAFLGCWMYFNLT